MHIQARLATHSPLRRRLYRASTHIDVIRNSQMDMHTAAICKRTNTMVSHVDDYEVCRKLYQMAQSEFFASVVAE